MQKVQTAKTSHRFLAFMIDMLLIGLVLQLMMFLLKTPFEGWLHLEQLQNEYFDLGFKMGVFDESKNVINGISTELQNAFLEASKDITTEFNKNNMIANAICALISSTIFQFIVPLVVGDGRTLGKIATKLKVVKKDGSKINFLNIFLRGFVGMTLIESVLSIFVGFLPFTLSAVLVLASNNKRALHDYIGGTTVTYVEGFAPAPKEKNINTYDHKRVKGFEYIDIEALEKREQEAQQRMENAKNNGDVIDNDEVKEEVKPQTKNASDISLEDIERREQEALERMKNKNSKQEIIDNDEVIDNEDNK